MKKFISKNNILLIILIVLFFLSLIIFNLDREQEKVIINENNKNSYILLSDYSRFFTVNSCIVRYINYLENKDIENILNVLNNEYLVQHGINSSNLYSYIDSLDGNYSFISRKIYYEKINDDNFKYYVYGNLLEDTIDGEVIKENKYYIVLLNLKEQLFNIAPYNGDIFREDI